MARKALAGFPWGKAPEAQEIPGKVEPRRFLPYHPGTGRFPCFQCGRYHPVAGMIVYRHKEVKRFLCLCSDDCASVFLYSWFARGWEPATDPLADVLPVYPREVVSW